MQLIQGEAIPSSKNIPEIIHMNQNGFQKMKPNQAKVLMLAKHDLSSLVHNAVRLENINFTLPEVQTILDGITIGGSKLSEQNITANQGKAWTELFSLVKNNEFNIDTETAFKIHAIAGMEEALEWGEVSQRRRSYRWHNLYATES
jgi:hypothetical protein